MNAPQAPRRIRTIGLIGDDLSLDPFGGTQFDPSQVSTGPAAPADWQQAPQPPEVVQNVVYDTSTSADPQVAAGSTHWPSNASIMPHDGVSVVNFRAGPGIDEQVLAELPPHSRVLWEADDGGADANAPEGWSQVQFQGQDGYVSTAFVIHDDVHPDPSAPTPPATPGGQPTPGHITHTNNGVLPTGDETPWYVWAGGLAALAAVAEFVMKRKGGRRRR